MNLAARRTRGSAGGASVFLCATVCAGLLAVLCALSAQAGNITWTNAAGGDYLAPGNWNSNSVPGLADVAIFSLTSQPYTVTWSGSTTSGAFKVNAGDVMWNLQGFTYSFSTNRGQSSVGTASNTANLSITNGTVTMINNGYSVNAGNFVVRGTNTTLRILANTAFTKMNYPFVYGRASLIVDGPNASLGLFGYFSGSPVHAIYGEVVVTNGGTLNATTGSSVGSGGALRLSAPGLPSIIALSALNATGEVRLDNTQATNAYSASMLWSGPLTLNNSRFCYYMALTPPAGQPILAGSNAVLQGTGRLEFNSLVNSNGTIRPGGSNSVGLLYVAGSLSNAIPGAAGGTIEIEVGGTASNQYDKLALMARGSLPRTLWAGGTLKVSLVDGFTPTEGDTFDILDFTNAVGAFDSIVFPYPAWNWTTNNLYTTGEIGYSEITSLDAPANVAATDGAYEDKVRVTWDAVAPATGYEIWRSLSAGTGTASRVATASGTTYDDTTTVAGEVNYYWVKATNATLVSDFSASNIGWRVASLPVPDVPADVSASDGVLMYQGRVVVTWSAASNATGYEIWSSLTADTGTAAQVGTTTALTYDDTTTVANVTNYYWVRAFNPAHTSDFSAYDSGWMAPVPPLAIFWTNAAGGDFQTAANWSPPYVPGTVASITNIAIFNLTTQPYTVTWSGPIANEAFRVDAGTVIFDLQGYTYTLANAISNSYVGMAATAADLTVSNGTLYTIDASFAYARLFTVRGTGTTLRVLANGRIDRPCYPNVSAGSRLIVDGTNAVFTPAGYMIPITGDIVITNGGYLSAWAGSDIGAGGSMRLSSIGTNSTVSLGLLNATGSARIDNGATVMNNDMVNHPLWSGSVTLDNARFYYRTILDPPTAGRAILNGASALLQGSGQFDFNGVVNSNGTIRPGGSNAVGLLSVAGSLSNAVPGAGGGTIDIEIGGTASNQYDRLYLTARGTLARTLWAGGTLNVTLINGFQPDFSTYKILDFASAVGQFDATNLPGPFPARWDASKLYTTGEITFRPPGGTTFFIR